MGGGGSLFSQFSIKLEVFATQVVRYSGAERRKAKEEKRNATLANSESEEEARWCNAPPEPEEKTNCQNLTVDAGQGTNCHNVTPGAGEETRSQNRNYLCSSGYFSTTLRTLPA